MDTLELFVRAGQLNQLRVGTSVDEVRQLLGEPQDVSVSKKPTIWKFGPVQLGFWKESPDSPPALTFLGVYSAPDVDELPSRLSWTGIAPRAVSMKPAFAAFLQRCGLTVHETVLDGAVHWTLPSGVQVTFDNDRLYSIQYAHEYASPKQSKKKQLAITLSEPLWHKVRDEAQRRHISPAQFCTELIQKELV